MKEQVRFLRVLEYTGDLDWVLEQVEKRSVKGSHVIGTRGTIREAMIGDVPTLLQRGTTEEQNG